MFRFRSIDLQNWLNSSGRKPLVLRGARQVGKTWLIRNLATENKKTLIEINFEKNPRFTPLFAINDPKQILININLFFQQEYKVEDSILFLDEIQAAPEILAKLRWFAEELPELPVVATGSLLEFVLANHQFSMPVGRISYMHLEPLSFIEFLLAKEKKLLVDYLQNYNFSMEIALPIHQQFLNEFKEYILVGGLPAAVFSWVSNKSFDRLSQSHSDLLATYRDDFSKFKGKLAIERLDEVFISVPQLLSQKFIYSKVNPDVQSGSIKNALNLLELARVCHKVQGTAANGLPLGAEKQKYFKEIFLDVGLCSTSLGLNLNLLNTMDITLINKGGIAEQVVGQLLRTINAFYIEPKLYYWLREGRNSNAEVDYLIQHTNKIIPVEVKAGKTGTLKALHLFMKLKKLSVALRINSDLPNITHLSNIKDTDGDAVSYLLLSIPFYLTEQIHKLLDENIQNNTGKISG